MTSLNIWLRHETSSNKQTQLFSSWEKSSTTRTKNVCAYRCSKMSRLKNYQYQKHPAVKFRLNCRRPSPSSPNFNLSLNKFKPALLHPKEPTNSCNRKSLRKMKKLVVNAKRDNRSKLITVCLMTNLRPRNFPSNNLRKLWNRWRWRSRNRTMSKRHRK